MLRLISSLTSSGNSHLSHGTKEKHRQKRVSLLPSTDRLGLKHPSEYSCHHRHRAIYQGDAPETSPHPARPLRESWCGTAFYPRVRAGQTHPPSRQSQSSLRTLRHRVWTCPHEARSPRRKSLSHQNGILE